jgi:uncharacterized protein
MPPAPVPQPDELTEPFWTGGGAGELRLQCCDDCGHLRFPPSPTCPRCLSQFATWVATSGRGEVLTFVVFHRAYQPEWTDRVPYAVLLVQLDDGPRLFSDFGGDLGALGVGARVHVVFSPLDGGYFLPRFALDDGDGVPGSREGRSGRDLGASKSALTAGSQQPSLRLKSSEQSLYATGMGGSLAERVEEG